MNRRILLVRAGPLLLLGVLLVVLVASSSLLGLIPIPLTPWPWYALGLALALLALTPALLTSGSPLPATLAVLVPVLAISSYGGSRLDWLKTLKDFGVMEDSAISPWRLVVGAGALLLVWGLHVADTGLRLRLRSEGRGISAGQARMAQRLVHEKGARQAGRALGLAALLGLVVLGARALGDVLPVGRLGFVAPLLAAILLATGALLIVGLRKDSADEAEKVRL